MKGDTPIINFDWCRGKRVSSLSFCETPYGYQYVHILFSDGTGIRWEQVGQDDTNLRVETWQ